MKDYYTEYLKAKKKLTRIEKIHDSHLKKSRQEIREYQMLVHRMRQEIHRLKGHQPEKCSDLYERILDEYGISENELKSPLRDRPIVNIRHAIFYFLRYRKKYSLMEIATIFNRDHSTVINGCKRVEEWQDMPKIYAKELMILENIYGTDVEKES